MLLSMITCDGSTETHGVGRHVVQQGELCIIIGYVKESGILLLLLQLVQCGGKRGIYALQRRYHKRNRKGER